MKSDYFYPDDVEQLIFYRIPKLLFTSPEFRTLSDSAKILYGLMLDRTSLSIKNNWIDKQGRVYIYFKIDTIKETMGCSAAKATRLLAELDSEKGMGLIEKVKHGQGKPSIIYLKKLIASEDSGSEFSEPFTDEKQEFQNCEDKAVQNDNSCFNKMIIQDFTKSECNNNKSNYNNKNNIEFINNNLFFFGDSENESRKEYIKDCVMFQINYDKLCARHDADDVNEVTEAITFALMSDDEPFFIKGERVSAGYLKNVFKKLDFMSVDSFLFGFERVDKGKIKNIRNYFISSLFCQMC